jgi:hypothetical protein
MVTQDAYCAPSRRIAPVAKNPRPRGGLSGRATGPTALVARGVCQTTYSPSSSNRQTLSDLHGAPRDNIAPQTWDCLENSQDFRRCLRLG